MKNQIQKYAYSAWLGGALAIFTNLKFYDWRFYAVLIPTIILVEWSQHENR